MNKIKPITQISDEDLLKSLEDNKDVKEEINALYSNDILDFISYFNLQQGEERVSSRLLYKIYKSWSKVKISKKSFVSHLGSFFSLSRNSMEHMILLNMSYNPLLKKSLSIIKRKVKTRRRFYKEHFENYLSKYNIKKGSFFVKSSVLYNLYDKWIYTFKKRNPLSSNQINDFFKLFNFKTKLIERDYWFGLDKSIIEHLTKDNINEMRNNVKETNKA